MGYSASYKTGNARDCLDDDVSLVKFSYKRARTFFNEDYGFGLEKLAHSVRSIIFPFEFLRNLIVAPLIYRVDNKYVHGTKEYEERISKIKIKPHPRGFGVTIDYSECD